MATDSTAASSAPPGALTEQSVASANDGVPKLRLDELLRELVNRGNEVLAARDALGKLLTANRSIMGELSLPAVLERIVQAACEIVGARYGALGVIAPDGTLERFVYTGVTPEQAAVIGPLPRGLGLLGALIRRPEPIRLNDIGADPRSVGFPSNHPPMKSFLGVPIKLRDAVYGNLYLTDCLNGEFTEEHTELALSLAGTAAIAIENARLFHDAEQRHQWLHASTNVTARLLAGPVDAMANIADQVREMADADVVSVVLPVDDSHLRMVAISGLEAGQLKDEVFTRTDSLPQLVIRTREPVRIDGAEVGMPSVDLFTGLDIGPAMALPLVGSASPRGALVVGRLTGRARFTSAELDMAATFAGHAAVALELAEARAAKERLVLLEERDRIARDLHDHVVQRLFAAGLKVQGALSSTPPALADRMTRVVDDIDETIRQIRTTIFALSPPPAGDSLRARLLAVCDEISGAVDVVPEIRFLGPVDTAVSAELADDVVAVVREALTNMAKHAQATAVSVTVRISDGAVGVEVLDDGTGPGASGRHSGVLNMRNRAERKGGSFSLRPRQTGGTALSWSVPLAW